MTRRHRRGIAEPTAERARGNWESVPLGVSQCKHVNPCFGTEESGIRVKVERGDLAYVGK